MQVGIRFLTNSLIEQVRVAKRVIKGGAFVAPTNHELAEGPAHRFGGSAQRNSRTARLAVSGTNRLRRGSLQSACSLTADGEINCPIAHDLFSGKSKHSVAISPAIPPQ